jgi:hypothetical protein
MTAHNMAVSKMNIFQKQPAGFSCVFLNVYFTSVSKRE